MSFVVLDGPDGSGKTTQIQLLKNVLEAKGQTVVLVREPGGTSLGEALRGILLKASYPIASRSEALLFNAARCQLVDEVIRPALYEGHWVLSDRFSASTLVYQALSVGDDLKTVENLCDFAIGDCQPSQCVILDVPYEITLQRLGKSRDRIESKGADYLKKVRQGFLDLAQSHHWPVLDATLSVDEVHAQILKELKIS